MSPDFIILYYFSLQIIVDIVTGQCKNDPVLDILRLHVGEQTAAYFAFVVIIVKAQELFLVQYQEIVQAAGQPDLN